MKWKVMSICLNVSVSSSPSVIRQDPAGLCGQCGPNALFGFNRISPVLAGPVPGNILPLISRHVYNHESALKTALTCDRKLGFTTFMNDPQMAGVSLSDGQKLFDDMLKNQKDYLPSGWF